LKIRSGSSIKEQLLTKKTSHWIRVNKDKGYELDSERIKKIKGCQRTSLLDSINSNGADIIYVSLFEKFEMNQRLSELKSWLIGDKWRPNGKIGVVIVPFIEEFCDHHSQMNGMYVYISIQEKMTFSS
jgi:hypothetical protein